MSRLLLLTRWNLRDPALWRVALVLLLVLVFALVSGVARVGGGGIPGGASSEHHLGLVLDFTAGRVVRAAYPFIFPVISVLVVLALVLERETGGLAALQAQGFRRTEIVVAQTLSVMVVVFASAFLAFLALPLLVEPRLAVTLSLPTLYPWRFWSSMPRLFLAILFTVLFAAALAMSFRRPAVALGVMMAFFFMGWYLDTQAGFYAVYTPPGAFAFAYRDGVDALPGIPLAGRDTYVLYTLAAIVAFIGALLHTRRRGELL
jgi:hypothetical protein